MGTRLYPNTTNVDKLERLAGVPAGTHARMTAILERYAALLDEATLLHHDDSWHRRQRIGEERYNALNADKDVGAMYHFTVFGWGKFDDAGLAKDESGRLTNMAAVRHVLCINRILVDAELTEGLHWC